jgi:hypothetical protein
VSAQTKSKAKLTRIIRTSDGGDLRTLADAKTYMLALPEGRALRRPWQNSVKLILDEGANIEAITTQIELALTLDGKIVLNSHS